MSDKRNTLDASAIADAIASGALDAESVTRAIAAAQAAVAQHAIQLTRSIAWNAAESGANVQAVADDVFVIGNASQAAVAPMRGKRQQSGGGYGGRSNLGGIALSGLTRDDYLLSVRRHVRAASNNADGGNSYRAFGGSVAVDMAADEARGRGLSIGSAQATITARVIQAFATASAPTAPTWSAEISKRDDNGANG